MYRKYSEELLQVARDLRNIETEAEKLLWQVLRNRKFFGLKFRRQVPFDKKILDFYCISKKIIIEIDGEYHDFHQQEDRMRDEYFANKGYRTLRIRNKEIFGDIEKVKDKIMEFIFKF